MSIYGNGNIGSSAAKAPKTKISTSKTIVEKAKTKASASKEIRDQALKTSPKTSNQTKSADTKAIRGDQDLTELVKTFNPKIGAVKEILYDHDKNIIGLLLQNGSPKFFTEKEATSFKTHIGA